MEAGRQAVRCCHVAGVPVEITLAPLTTQCPQLYPEEWKQQCVCVCVCVCARHTQNSNQMFLLLLLLLLLKHSQTQLPCSLQMHTATGGAGDTLADGDECA